MLDVPSTRYMERGKKQAERKPAQEQRQVVLVFQGGGALGAYQAGVYQALHESGIEPDWIIGTSIASHIAQQRQVHKLRHVISELVKLIPEDARKDPLVKDLAEYGCLTRMHVVRLLAPRLDNESHTKDIDFSPTGIRPRWEADHADTVRALRRSPWDENCDPLEGVILHEPVPHVATVMEG